jgi:hypothetical protein
MAAPMRTALRVARHSSSSRSLAIFSPAKAQVQPVANPAAKHVPPSSIPSQSPASGRQGLAPAYFEATGSRWSDLGDKQSKDPNKAKLGKTLRVLQGRLPTLLQYPLPQDILAHNISLHLFPTTHPHLPTVSGRVAYSAALWTSPIAWNRVPIIGNVKLEILAERMTSEPLTFLPRRAGAMPEQLVVRWSEQCKSPDDKDGGIAKALRLNRGVDPNKAFTGLFIFDFDQEGKILSHTIEHAQEGGNWEQGMGAKFVGLTDWLLGGMKGQDESPIPMFEKIKRRHYE